MALQKATKEQSKLRMALQGPSGSGKTKSGLRIATGMGGKIAVLDTERGSASKYANEFDFDVEEFTNNYDPRRLIKFIEELDGYNVLIVDSLTHFWNNDGGFLELVDKRVADMKARGNRADSFAAWKDVTPIYNDMVHAIMTCKAHVIITMRAKMEYVKDQDEKGKTTVKRVGMAPQMRDDFQYEMDVEGMMNMDNDLVIGKTRYSELKGKFFHEPDEKLGAYIAQIVSSGAPPVERPKPVAASTVDPKVAACLAQIAAAGTRAELEAIGAKLANTPQWFQDAVLPAYDTRAIETANL